ncbi:MAG: T9SS type A sorting domain-containing protein [Prevotella sp.]|nr:T9SS type A sorting domain-containing protein [Prevotella sp.]
MKKILLIAVLTLTVLHVSAQDSGWYLSTDKGQKVALNNVSFFLAADNDSLFTIVLKEGDAIEKVRQATVKQGTATAISTLRTATPEVKLSGIVSGELSLSGLDSSTKVEVYSANGIRQNVSISHGSETSVNVRSLQPGLYILKVGRQSVKFMKR